MSRTKANHFRNVQRVCQGCKKGEFEKTAWLECRRWKKVCCEVAGEDGAAGPYSLVGHIKFYLSFWAEWEVIEDFELRMERWTEKQVCVLKRLIFFFFWEKILSNTKSCLNFPHGKNWTNLPGQRSSTFLSPGGTGAPTRI